MKKSFRYLLAGIIFIMMLIAVPTLVWASGDDDSASGGLPESNKLMVEHNTTANHFENLNLNNEDFPEKFDLRNCDGKNYTTPVKLQNPWGVCWSFGATAALETTSLYNAGLSYDEFKAKYGKPYDLSEKFPSWFAGNPHGKNDYYPAQEGEGTYKMDPTAQFAAGQPQYVSSLYSQGEGPVDETLCPYRGTEGLLEPLDKYWCYSKDDNWSLDESQRFTSFDSGMNEVCFLPPPAVIDSQGEYSYDEQATKAIKKSLMEGKAVAMLIRIDKTGDYMDQGSFHQYIDENLGMSHCVCIVGWDDTIAKDDYPREAPGNGAWIIKNSWGAEEGTKYAVDYLDDLNNNCNIREWGMKEDGDTAGGGYCLVSYYDHTLGGPFNFDMDLYTGDTGNNKSFIMQHDLALASSFEQKACPDSDKVLQANVFSNVKTQRIKSISVQTGTADTTVKAKVYLLKNGYSNPTDGQELYSFEKTYDYAGFHRYYLPENDQIDIPQGSTYSIVTENLVEGVPQENVAVDYSKHLSEQVGNSIYMVGVVNPGESYEYKNGQWRDWTEVHQEYLDTEDVESDNPGNRAYVDLMSELQTNNFEIIQDQIYTGKAYNPSDLVKSKDVAQNARLIEGTDYEIVKNKCTDMTSEGKQTITLKGIGDYINKEIQLNYNIVAQGSGGGDNPQYNPNADGNSDTGDRNDVIPWIIALCMVSTVFALGLRKIKRQ